ncbi:MAG: YggS family pyridoxal phosphate-dependent enzyme [Actinomycetota bacterium]|nr:YggS family pyridoxal phosphate-dependent enzyme [Actinomycetota bacterium]
MPSVEEVQLRLAGVRERLAALGSSAVTVIAVTKGFGADAIVAAHEAGLGDIGENYAQELLAKIETLEQLDDVRPRVHFIGHVQSNKVRQLVTHVDAWHTVDRVSLVDDLARREATGEVMIQVNTTGEDTKSGCSPAELPALVDHAREAGLALTGLMTMGPTDGDRPRAATAFRSLRTLADGAGLASCSMGMSADYDIAVAEGATHVRLGTLLFGERHRRG